MHIDDRNAFESIPEADLQDRMVGYFQKWFDVDYEITSLCGTKRIDILMFHHSDTDKLYPFGIELKKTGVKRGGDIARWCMQASGYTKLTFNRCQPTIFIAPQISGWYLDEGERVSRHNCEDWGYTGCHHNVNSFLYKSFGFGELQKFYVKDKGYMRLVINTFQIWDSRNPHTINYQKLLLCR